MKVVAVLLMCVPLLAKAEPLMWEADLGCLWTKSRASCLVQNRFDRDIECNVTIVGITRNGRTFRDHQVIVAQAMKFNASSQITVREGDELSHVTAYATCKYAQ